MSEQIAIREAARRLGVSDTAIRKAIAAKRVTVAGQTTQGWPLLEWPRARDEWLRNSDVSKRSHVGPQGSERRERYTGGAAPEVVLPPSSRMDEQPAAAGGVEPFNTPAQAPAEGAARGPAYAQSRAVREAYMARLAKLEFEERSGKLVSVDDVKAARFKEITAAKTKIMGIPASCKSRIADLPLQVVATIEAICRQALEDLANGVS